MGATGRFGAVRECKRHRVRALTPALAVGPGLRLGLSVGLALGLALRAVVGVAPAVVGVFEVVFAGGLDLGGETKKVP